MFKKILLKQMNMRALIKKICISAIPILLLFSSACKKEIEEKQVYDNIIYQVDTSRLYSSSAEKTKQKSQTQYISIMYSDLFSTNISGNVLSELSELSLAMGDKTMANELTLSHYLNSTALDKPSDTEMRSDVESFVELTYLRFYQRNPSPYEKIYLIGVIDNDPILTVLDIYTAFILSNEYYYY